MRRYLSLAIALISTCLAAAEPDLSFEDDLSGWQCSDRNAVMADTDIRIGNRSIRLENRGEKRVSAGRMLELDPDTLYDVTFYVKGKGIQSGPNQGARIGLNAGNHWERISATPGLKPDTGTFDWKLGRGVIDTSRFPDSRIRLELNLIGTGTVWFDELKITKRAPSAKKEVLASFHRSYSDAIRNAVLKPLGISGFFEPDEPVKLQLLIEGTAKSYEYVLTVKDDTGKVVFTQEKTALTGEIVLPGQPRGYYTAECDIYADDEKAYTIQGGFAVAPVPGKRDPFFQFGYGVQPELHDGYRRVGCGSIALKLDWRPSLKHRDAKQAADQLLNRYKPFLDSGDFLLIADVPTTLPREMRKKEELEAGYPLLNDDFIRFYLDFLVETASRFRIKEWDLGQETPSNATSGKCVGTWSEAMANFVTLVRLGSRQLKKIDPGIRIFAGGNNVMASTEKIEPIEMGDIVKDIDGYYIDAYTGQWDLVVGGEKIPELDLMKFYRASSALSVQLGKGKYIGNNETGYSINFGAPFDTGLAVKQAVLTARSLIISKAAPVLHYQLFRPNDYNRIPAGDSSRHMATVWKTVPFGGKYHRVPLPGGAMYVTAASELAFVKFEEEIIGGSIYSYVFTKPDGSTLVTLWNIEKEQPFTMELPPESIVLNMYGRDVTGQPLVIGPEPHYITFKAPSAQIVPLIRQAVEANTPEAVCTAQADRVFVRSLVKKTCDAEIQLPGKASVKVKLLPGKTSVFPMEVAAAGKLMIGSRRYDIPLEQVPIHTLRRVKDMTELRKSESGRLHYPDHIRPVEALQPELCYFKTPGWNPNGHNVSAQYWTGYDDENFYLAVEVDDPVHLQRYTGKDIWKDDCLQFVLSPEDYPPSAVLLSAEKKPSSEYNFGLALTPKGPEMIKFSGKNPGIQNFPFSVVRKGGLTRYEVAIPWSAVGGKAKRFGFLVFDNNNPAQATAPYRLELTPGIAGGADSSKLARVKYE